MAQVATISAESAELGNLIAEVMTEVGKDGVVTIEESKSLDIKKRSSRACSLIAATRRLTW